MEYTLDYLPAFFTTEERTEAHKAHMDQLGRMTSHWLTQPSMMIPSSMTQPVKFDKWCQDLMKLEAEGRVIPRAYGY